MANVNKSRPTCAISKHFFNYRAFRPGITLFELMAVVCIIGVISSFGMVSLKPLWEKHQLHQSISEVDAQVQMLRLKAIVEDCTYQMKIEGHYLIFRKKINDKWLGWNKYRLSESTKALMSGSIYFDNKGFASPKSITIQLEQRYQQLIININGRTRRSEII